MIDFEGVAGLIDTVLGAAPEHLPNLLGVLWSSDETLEARVILEIVVRCRDPLAPLATLCRDALKAASDLEAILRRPNRKDVAGVCHSGHANAILNLCDVALAQPNPHKTKRRERIRRIRPGVKVVAVAEMNERQDDIERIQVAREVALPNLWTVLETYLTMDKKRRASPRKALRNSGGKKSRGPKAAAPVS